MARRASFRGQERATCWVKRIFHPSGHLPQGSAERVDGGSRKFLRETLSRGQRYAAINPGLKRARGAKHGGISAALSPARRQGQDAKTVAPTVASSLISAGLTNPVPRPINSQAFYVVGKVTRNSDQLLCAAIDHNAEALTTERAGSAEDFGPTSHLVEREDEEKGEEDRGWLPQRRKHHCGRVAVHVSGIEITEGQDQCISLPTNLDSEDER